jgi:predicted component of type VI protein secretion system
MLRLPYGAKSDPVSSFKFEEFTQQVGLSGMLWANPAVLVAILLAETYTKDTKAVDLGSVMSLGDIPYYYVTDRHGDQVAMPCTNRNLTSAAVQETLSRGFMPVVWVKGHNEIRLATFDALGGDMIEGPWTAKAQSITARSTPDLAFIFQVNVDDKASASDKDAELTELLARFEDEGKETDKQLIDAELAALLNGL